MKPQDNNYSLFVLKDIAIIKAQLDSDPFKHKTSSDLLIAVASANRKSVEKAFKAIYGCGIKTYQLKQRLVKSKAFMEEGMTIKLAAVACLYKSQSAYGAAFKKEFGIPPSEWVKIVSNETTRKLSGKQPPRPRNGQ